MPDADRPDGPPPAASVWRPVIALALVLAVIAAWRAWPVRAPQDAGDGPQGASAERTVEVRLSIGDEPLAAASAPAGTALSVLRAAAQQEPAFEPSVRGEGASAFVDAIGGVLNEGAGGRNWTYRVNDNPGDRSAAVAPVAAGDRVLWEFTTGE